MTRQTFAPARDSTPQSPAVQATDPIAQASAPPVKSSAHHEPAGTKPKADARMVLDLKAIEAARHSLDQGAVTPHYGPWRDDIIQLLNDALATELVCVLRYKRHHFTAEGLASPKIAEEFLVHANEESAHADRLAKRIVELGGQPDFSPDSLTRRSHAAYDDSEDLKAMIKANLTAERVAIESYSQMIALIGDKDSTTRRLIEEILSVEQAHAEELRDWLAA
jgi:bacterioferritin